MVMRTEAVLELCISWDLAVAVGFRSSGHVHFKPSHALRDVFTKSTKDHDDASVFVLVQVVGEDLKM